VSDVMTTARTARESLARALNALQSDPNAPPKLLELAAPIAQSMGALMNIEKTGQIMPHADLALNNVRNALQALQQQTSVHPSVAQAMEGVASSLGLIHNLWRAGQPQAQAPQAAQPAQAYAATVAAPMAAAAAQAQVAASQRQPAPAAPAGPSARPGDVAMINADLGTHSATNFYKGLSGNDIVDHGGLFVSTYMVPKIGTNVRLKVSLPGGYEFEANAVVSWSREASDAGGDGAPPGFGAKFTQITQEARQLIYRYVRNREPLFRDDL
jgi:Tfp pilus assembly protein PilZ